MSSSNIFTLDIPIAARWKISQDKLEKTKKENESWLIKSEKYDITELPNVKYYLAIGYPNNKEREIFIALLVQMKEDLKISANIKISIPSATYSGISHETKKNKTNIYATFIATTDEFFNSFNNFFVNGFTIITMEGILCIEMKESNYISLRGFQMKSDNLGHTLWERHDKDFAVVVNKNVVKVHKIVIAAKSSVFDKMIHSGLKESKENKVVIIDFDFETVKNAMKFCYGIYDENLIKPTIAFNLIRFADKYDINDLKISMEQFLSTIISPNNVCKITNASILSNSIKLREQCFEYLFECNQKKILVCDLDLLDTTFALELMKASFSRIIV